MSNFKSKGPKMDIASDPANILDLPNEILEVIFRQLHVNDVQNRLAKVCKRFLKISRFPGMVKNVKLTVQDMWDEAEMNQCLMKAKEISAIHLESKLELEHIDESGQEGKYLMEYLKPLAPFLKKISLEALNYGYHYSKAMFTLHPKVGYCFTE